jgi:uncharacterized membrane protein (UPF0127 family)
VSARRRIALILGGPITLSLLSSGCVGTTSSENGDSTRSGAQTSSAAQRDYPLDTLSTTELTIAGHTFRVWLAQDWMPRAAGAARTPIEEGLMFVPPEEIADDQGMLFVFDDERVRGFWMLNTITPLDIAYARADGTIVEITQMPPQTLRTFSSIEPAMFALEVKQGTFAQLGIEVGDAMNIPAAAFE